LRDPFRELSEETNLRQQTATAWTLSEIDQSTIRAFSGSRVLRPRRGTSRYASQDVTCHASTTCSHSASTKRSDNVLPGVAAAAPRRDYRIASCDASFTGPTMRSYKRRPIAFIEETSIRSPRRGSLPIRRRSMVRKAWARASENVASRARASGFCRARNTARRVIRLKTKRTTAITSKKSIRDHIYRWTTLNRPGDASRR